MKIKEIISTKNPLVKQWIQLQEKKGRVKQGKYIVEGTHLVLEALRSGADIESIAYSMERGIPREIGDLPEGKEAEWIAVSEAVIQKCTDTVTPQPVFAVIRKQNFNAETLLLHHASLVVVVDGVQDPGNLGTIIRSADAAGASGVVVSRSTVDLYNPKTIRATMGSIFHLPVLEAELPELLHRAKKQQVQLVTARLDAERYCYELDMTRPTWFVVGNEGSGVSPEVSKIVENGIKIPMRGQAESLNVAMAATVLLYEALRQRHFSPNKNSCP